MSGDDNKRIMRDVMAALAEGESQPFVDVLHDDVTWTVSGHNPWSRSYRGKQALLGELFGPFMSRLERPYRSVSKRMIAEGDLLVMEVHGVGNLTKEGKAYDQEYCWVCRMQDGKLKDVIEYADFHHAMEVVGPPAPVDSPA